MAAIGGRMRNGGMIPSDEGLLMAKEKFGKVLPLRGVRGLKGLGFSAQPRSCSAGIITEFRVFAYHP
jgi:hypothetical protein